MTDAGAEKQADLWLALVIGNTRLHWAAFKGDALLDTWHTHHLTPQQVAPLMTDLGCQQRWISLGAAPQPSQASLAQPPLYVASVVPDQAELWRAYPHLHTITLDQLPLDNLYPTLGIDRTLNLLGAGDRYGWPVMVVDGGTALTFTAGQNQGLIGGAILPGITLQLRALGEQTAALPQVQLTSENPPRWASNTHDAIRSGVFWGQRAVVLDALMTWWQDYPAGQAVITGGDGLRLYESLSDRPEFANLHPDPDLVLWGVRAYRRHHLNTTDT
ncbi:MAG: pantothenate kinase [Cyanobacteria bacterium]|nr:pantothenate kinase [Cyanobacteriota bacterium]MDA0865065.1 pantothenate kinase [Cyanobacteriota bacterium]